MKALRKNKQVSESIMGEKKKQRMKLMTKPWLYLDRNLESNISQKDDRKVMEAIYDFKFSQKR